MLADEPRPVYIDDTLRGNKVLFTPKDPLQVTFYTCGPTTYDLLHVGNARAQVVADVICRILEVLGYRVILVRNFTDVDDKILNRAHEQGVDPLQLSEKYIAESLKDMGQLNLRPANFTPKVSDTIPEIISFVENLVEKKHAYVVDGDVWFSVKTFPTYGKLSGNLQEGLERGVRTQLKEGKSDSADFALWKKAKKDEIAWDSPWGKGRPGWHIECSAMAAKFLGPEIDLHHGGVDLIFPHHENEIAQSEACHNKTFARFWCHHQHLHFASEKMSKSLGNVVTTRDFCNKYSGEVLRYLFISYHYRTVIDFKPENIDRAISELFRLSDFHSCVVSFTASEKNPMGDFIRVVPELIEKIKNELAQDFNVPAALSHLFSWIRQFNQRFPENKRSSSIPIHPQELTQLNILIVLIQQGIGLFSKDPTSVLIELNRILLDQRGLSEIEIQALIDERNIAKASKDFATADRIRDQITSKGIIIRDLPGNITHWRCKPEGETL